ncbi:hypothetical protein MPRG_53180 [Mycobacterium paragordonae]|uniref:Uncharacterized protein n=1 Tax=Mycobacterium paragordonae TaxID=1389713 RepID=A0ABQ1CCI7_9MYCO|nr:hypothetical protein MPRG_53180 [Mycobacterium paragordonae]
MLWVAVRVMWGLPGVQAVTVEPGAQVLDCSGSAAPVAPADMAAPGAQAGPVD